MTILDQIVARKREEVAERKRARPVGTLNRGPRRVTRGFADHLRPLIAEDEICTATSIRAIADIKRRSPSRGALLDSLDPETLALDYERCGAAALSVLTDRDFFGGGDEDLIAAQRGGMQAASSPRSLPGDLRLQCPAARRASNHRWICARSSSVICVRFPGGITISLTACLWISSA